MANRAIRKGEYRHGGTLLPRVTEVVSIINKPGLNKWKVSMGSEAQDVMEAANKFGQRVHDVIENAMRAGCGPEDCRCGLADRDTIYMPPFHDAVVDFVANYVDEILGVEMPLVSERLGVGGTPDLYVRLLSGRPAVIDFKTSKAIYAEYDLQTAAYSMLLYLNGYDIDKRWIVRLDKADPGEYQIRQCEDDWADARAFLAALELWHWKYGGQPGKEHRYIL